MDEELKAANNEKEEKLASPKAKSPNGLSSAKLSVLKPTYIQTTKMDSDNLFIYL